MRMMHRPSPWSGNGGARVGAGRKAGTPKPYLQEYATNIAYVAALARKLHRTKQKQSPGDKLERLPKDDKVVAARFLIDLALSGASADPRVRAQVAFGLMDRCFGPVRSRIALDVDEDADGPIMLVLGANGGRPALGYSAAGVVPGMEPAMPTSVVVRHKDGNGNGKS